MQLKLIIMYIQTYFAVRKFDLLTDMLKWEM